MSRSNKPRPYLPEKTGMAAATNSNSPVWAQEEKRAYFYWFLLGLVCLFRGLLFGLGFSRPWWRPSRWRWPSVVSHTAHTTTGTFVDTMPRGLYIYLMKLHIYNCDRKPFVVDIDGCSSAPKFNSWSQIVKDIPVGGTKSSELEFVS